jgi:hypothetical protein
VLGLGREVFQIASGLPGTVKAIYGVIGGEHVRGSRKRVELLRSVRRTTGAAEVDHAAAAGRERGGERDSGVG